MLKSKQKSVEYQVIIRTYSIRLRFAIYPSDRYLPLLNRNIDQGSCYG